MFKSILKLSLLQWPPILLFLLVSVAAGLSAYSKLGIGAYPNPTSVILKITTQAPGLSAEEMERYCTVPMEIGLAATPGVENIRPTSFYGLSSVRVTFRYGIDYHFVYIQAALVLQQNVSLPSNVQLQIQTSSLVGEVVHYQLKGSPHSGLTNLRILQDWVLQCRLKTVPSVAQVVSWGGTAREYDVEVDPGKLEAYGVTLPQMMTALGNVNINAGGRTINLGQQSVNIHGIGLIQDVRDIDRIILTQTNRVPVQVKNMAKAKIGFAPRLGTVDHDNESDIVTAIAVADHIMQTSDVVAHVRAELDKISTDGTLPAGVRVERYYDRSGLASVITRTVMRTLPLGCLLMFFIQQIFLGDLCSAIIVSANIPFVLLFSILILLLTGESTSLLSVSVVDFGIIVDSFVILVKNIFRNFQMSAAEQTCLLTSRDAKVLGLHVPERLRMTFISALQVDRAAFFPALITVTAFVPLFIMQGVEGRIFGPMARTYGYALAGAFIATFTVTPALCSYLLPRKIEEKGAWLVRTLYRLHRPALKWFLSSRRTAMAIGAVVLAATVMLMPLLGMESLPMLGEGNLQIRLTMLQTASLESGMVPVSYMCQTLLEHLEVRTVVSAHGRPDDGSGATSFYNAEFFVPFRPLDQWSAGMTREKLIVQAQKEFTSKFTEVGLNFSQYIQDNVEEGLSSVKGANSVRIVGPDPQALERLADQVQNEMSRVRGVIDPNIFRVLGQPNLNARINREATTRYGLNTGDVNTVIQAALPGSQVTTILEGDRQLVLTVQLAPEYRATTDVVRNIRVAYSSANGGNAYILLLALTDITLDTGASYIYHEKNTHYIPVKFNVRGCGLGGTVEEAQQRTVQHVRLPQGYRIGWAGEFEGLEQAKQRLAIMVPISILLIPVLFYGLFDSLRDNLMVLAGIPLAITDGIVTLFLTELDLSVSVTIGFTSLFGVSVIDSTLMAAYYNDLRRERDPQPTGAIFCATQQRMWPMLMVTLSACIGLFPAAISTSIGSQAQRPLATVVVGGMLVGPPISLVIVSALRAVSLGKEPPPGEPTPEEALV